MAYRRKTFKKRSFKKRTYKRKSYARKASPIRKMVKREIARQVENKQSDYWLVEKALYPSNHVDFPDNTIPLGPDGGSLAIAQGTGQGARVGNRIKTKKLVFSGVITPKEYNAVSNPNPRPLELQMIFYYDREDPSNLPVPAAQFFQNGNSTSGFDGTLVDMVKNINQDRYRVVKRVTHKLGFAQYAGTAGSTSTQAAFQAYANNDFKTNIRFRYDLTKHYPKDVRYNDSTTDPATRGLYCTIQYVDAFGGNLLSTTVAADISYGLQYIYEDA